MKWYACLNESALARYGENLRVAIRSAIDIAELEPHVIFDGDPDHLRAAIGHDDFRIYRHRSSFAEAIEATPEIDGSSWRRRVAAGALLRFDIPLIETEDEFALYTDCDVLFTRRVDFSPLRPPCFAGAPMHDRHDWSQMCSGVMLLNVPAMRRELDEMTRRAPEWLAEGCYDQEILNLHFAGRWDHLPIHAHWKPYWGIEPQASIVHFHGPKAQDIRRYLAVPTPKPPYRDINSFLFSIDPESCRYYLRFYEVVERACRRGETVGRASLAALRLEAASVGMRRALAHAGAVIRERSTFEAKERAPIASPYTPSEGFERATFENFEERSYLSANYDVFDAVRRGRTASAAAHFRRFGHQEGRLQRKPVDRLCDAETFDARAYLARNPDVAYLIARGRYESAQDHFERRGLAEGRRQLDPFLASAQNDDSG